VAYAWREAVAARHLGRGGVIVTATEGVFGLTCRASSRAACLALAGLKSRGSAKPFIVVAANEDQVRMLVDFTAFDPGPVVSSWPGPETWILPPRADTPPWLVSRNRTIAVRISAHPQLNRLAWRVGPLISTSANLPGRPAALSLLAARRYFGGRVSFYLPGRLLNPGVPSRIRHAESGRVVRG